VIFQERLSTPSIRYIESDKLRLIHFDEFLEDFITKNARTKPFLLFTVLWSAILDSIIVAFCTYFNNNSIFASSSQSRRQGSIDGISPSKLKYETLSINRDFIKFSECQVPLRICEAPLLQTFWRRFWLKPHTRSRDSFVASDRVVL